MSPEVIALAYAGYAKAKHDWVTHIEQLDGAPPSAEAVDRWIAELPKSRFEDILEDASDYFALAASAYMQAELEAAVESARDDAIVREVAANNATVLARVEGVTSFGSTFWPNLFIGVVASLVFSVLVIVVGLIFIRPLPLRLRRLLDSVDSALHQ